jgi:hypothetical protein
MVRNPTKEITHRKNDNALLKQEIKNLHSVIEASPRLPSKYIPKEQCIPPAEVCHKDAAYIKRVPTAAFSVQTLPAAPVPSMKTLNELSYRDVIVAGISPSGFAPLPDRDGLKTVMYRKKTATSMPRTEMPATKKVKHRRQPCISVSRSIYHCLSSGNLKGLKHCLSPVLAPKLLLMTFPKH